MGDRKGIKGKRRFIDAPQEVRCKRSIVLSDKTGAQCGRRRTKDSMYCKQHDRMAREDQLEAELYADMQVPAAIPPMDGGYVTHDLNQRWNKAYHTKLAELRGKKI